MKFLFLFLLIFTFGCSESDSLAPTFSYLALGDSYTIGESVSETERWPVLLSNDLKERGIDLGLPKIIARTGWRTNQLMDSLESAPNIQEKYELISLLIGVNNQFQGRSVESFIPEFEALLQKAISLVADNTDRVIVLSIPDYGKVPFFRNRGGDAIGREIDSFNEASKTICDRYGVKYFDITPLSREVENDNELISSDLLHPSGKMYQLWVDLIIDDVANRLKNE